MPVQILIHQLRFPAPIASNILISALVNVNVVILFVVAGNLITNSVDRAERAAEDP